MSISIQTQRNDYFGDGTTVIFPYVFKIWAISEMNVILTDTDGNETVLVYPTDYQVSGVLSTNGGNVTLTVPAEEDFQVTLRRERLLEQTTSIRNEGEFYAATHEDTFDKLLMIDQQQQEQIDRCLIGMVSENAAFDFTLPRMYGNEERVLGTNVDGSALELGPTFTEIDQAQGFAEAAAISATDAAASASDADASAAAAEAAAAAAEEASANGFDSTNSPHSVTDGQLAAALTGETFDSAVYSSILIFFEIARGTTVKSIGWMTLSYLNSVWVIEEGPYSGLVHGVTWSLTGTTIAQLCAALDTGAGNGTIKFKKTYFQ